MMPRLFVFSSMIFIFGTHLYADTPPRPGSSQTKPKSNATSYKDISRSLEKEQAIYLDRLQFCTKLRQIAIETHDDNLLEKAEYLEKKCEEVFQSRTHKLPALIQEVKASETRLEEMRNNPTPSGTASTNQTIRRAPNGRPIYSRE